MSKITQSMIELGLSNSKSSGYSSAPSYFSKDSPSLASISCLSLQVLGHFSNSPVKQGTRDAYKSSFSVYLKSTCPLCLGDR